MAQVFVISDNNALMKSIERYFRFVKGKGVASHNAPQTSDMSPQWVSQMFDSIASWIELSCEAEGGANALNGATAFVSLYDPGIMTVADLNFIATNEGTWAAVVAMLVLAFPEVHWVFVTAQEPPAGPTKRLPPGVSSPLFLRAHFLGPDNTLAEIMALHDAKFCALFDPTGLRNLIRARIRRRGGKGNGLLAPYIPVRREAAAAIDEEEAYAYFNAYVAYRLGYQTHAVSSYKMMEDVFGRNRRGPYPTLLFEDLYLNFPDKPHTVHLSNLAQRKTYFPGIEHANVRVFITSGHERLSDRMTHDANEALLREWVGRAPAGARRYTKTLFKPLSGFFDLWEKSGLKRWLRGSRGLAPGYVWPPSDKEASEPQGSHSSPGRLLDVANRLIKRAQKISEGAEMVPDAVHGALLVLDAQEYLGHRTPTTSLEALSLKHSLEVMAECKFYGVEYNKDIGSRLKEVSRETRSISEWFRRKTRSLSELDAEVRIVSDLVLLFREYNQFDEEQACLARARKLHRQVWLKKNKAWVWPFYLLRWYVELLLGSMPVFVMAIALWIVALSVMFGLFCNCRALAPHSAAHPDVILNGLDHAVTTFFGIQPAHTPAEMEEIGYMAFGISLLAVLAGFVHLGIFVSHLYSLIVRR